MRLDVQSLSLKEVASPAYPAPDTIYPETKHRCGRHTLGYNARLIIMINTLC